MMRSSTVPAAAASAAGRACGAGRRALRPTALLRPLLTALLVGPTLLGAQARLEYKETRDASADRRAPQPVVMSISGGISLGAYQAGVNWGLLELYRAANTYPDFAARFRVPRVALGAIAGASAGNINTLLWAAEACTKPAAALPPDSSLFWQTWTSVGLPQLLRRGLRPESSEHALFDRRFFRDTLFTLVRRRLAANDLQPECLVRIGITLTRIHPDTLRLGDLSIPTQRFVTAFNARVARPAGRRQMHFAWPDSTVHENQRFGKLVFPPRDSVGGGVGDSTIFDIVEASSAFPLAFQPKELGLYHPAERRVQRDWYMDGGVFDNNPVGLALELYADANRSKLGDSRPDTVTVIYVNPGRLRGPLDTLRAPRPSEVVSGGIMSAVQMLGGAVATARMYELQFWARDQRIRDPDKLLVRLSSRAHPVMGEHLYAFGAFLARPFREYDFYVGVYDALHFAAREYTCQGDGTPDCVARAVGEMIGRPRIDFGTVGPPLLERLFAAEFRAPALAPYRESLRGRVRWGPGVSDTARTRVLLALDDAQRQTQWVAERPSCGNVPLPSLILCGGGLLDLLDAFGRAPGVPAVVGRWRRTCDDSTFKGPAKCQEVRELSDLVSNPRKFASRTVDRLLERMWDVEHQIHVNVNRRRAADGARAGDRKRLDAEMQTAVLLALYRARPLRPRYGFEWSASSAPERARLVRWVVPFTAAANLGDSGFELGYRPTWHLNTTVAMTFPVTAHWTTPIVRPGDDWPSADSRKVGYYGGGAGVAFRGVVPRPAGLLLPEFGVLAQLLGPRSGWADRTAVVGEAYGDFTLLAGRLRVALRYSPEPDQLFDGGRWATSVGIADLNGLAYWLFKLRR